MNEITHKKPNTKQADEALDNPELEAYGLANKHEEALKQEEENMPTRTKGLLYDVTNVVRERSHYAADAVREKSYENLEAVRGKAQNAVKTLKKAI